MSRSKFKRDSLFVKTGFRCVYCNEEVPEEERSMDHIYPKSKGGTLANANLLPSCKSCNVKRGVVFPPSLLAHEKHKKYVLKKERKLGIYK